MGGYSQTPGGGGVLTKTWAGAAPSPQVWSAYSLRLGLSSTKAWLVADSPSSWRYPAGGGHKQTSTLRGGARGGRWQVILDTDPTRAGPRPRVTTWLPGDERASVGRVGAGYMAGERLWCGDKRINSGVEARLRGKGGELNHVPTGSERPRRGASWEL